jgi:hypothetical protein
MPSIIAATCGATGKSDTNFLPFLIGIVMSIYYVT